MIAPTSLAIVLDSFPAESRAAGVGLWGAAAAAAAAIGPTLGGGAGRARRLAPRLPRQPAARRRDPVRRPQPPAAAEARSTAACPTCPGRRCWPSRWRRSRSAIVEGNDWGWTAPATLGCFAAAALAARRASSPAASATRGRSSSRRSSPTAPSALGNLGTLLFAAAFFSLILGNVLFLTSIWGYTSCSAGLAALPGPALSTVVAGPAGRLADRFGHRAVIVPGTLVFAAGVLVLRSAGAEPDYARPLAAGRAASPASASASPSRPSARPPSATCRRPLRDRQRRQRRLPPGRGRARHRDPDRDRRRTGLAARGPRRLRRRLPLRRPRRARLRRHRARPAPAASARRARRSARPTARLRSPAAISIAAPPTSPSRVAPSASRASRSPLTRKPPLPSPKSASSGWQPRSRRGCSSTRQPTPPPIAHSARAQARPPSLTSWAEASRPARTASRTTAQAAATASTSGWGRPASSSPRCLASSEPASTGAKGPIRPIASPSRAKALPATRAGVGQLADHADHRRRVDRAVGPLVVEGDVAADDGHAERRADVGEAADGAVELPGRGGLLGVAEIEAVGQAERLGADAGEVLGALEHRLDRAVVGVAGDPPTVAVDRDRDRVAGLRQRQHRGVGRLRSPYRARADHRVVLLEGPALGGDAGGGEQRQQLLLGRDAGRERPPVAVDPAFRLGRLEVVERAAVDQRLDRHLADHVVVAQDPNPGRCR